MTLRQYLKNKSYEVGTLARLTATEKNEVIDKFYDDSTDLLIGDKVIEIVVVDYEIDIYKYNLNEYVNKYGDDILYKYGILEE